MCVYKQLCSEESNQETVVHRQREGGRLLKLVAIMARTNRPTSRVEVYIYGEIEVDRDGLATIRECERERELSSDRTTVRESIIVDQARVLFQQPESVSLPSYISDCPPPSPLTPPR